MNTKDIIQGYMNLISPLSMGEIRTLVHSRLTNLKARVEFETTLKNRTLEEVRFLSAAKLAEFGPTIVDQVIVITDSDDDAVLSDSLEIPIYVETDEGEQVVVPHGTPTARFRLPSTQTRIPLLRRSGESTARILPENVRKAISHATGDLYRRDPIPTVPRLKPPFPGAYSILGAGVEKVAPSRLRLNHR